MSAAFQTYDFTLAAGGAQRIPVYGKYVRVQSSTGAVNLRGDFGYLKNLLPGQGQAINAFSWVIVEDASGAANVGSIIVGEEGFVDNRMILGSSSAIALDSPTQLAITRPTVAAGANWNSVAALLANTPMQIFAPGLNINGAVVWTAESLDPIAAGKAVFIAKNAAPTTVQDGEVIAQSSFINVTAGGYDYHCIKMAQAQRLAAGLGLYYIGSAATGGGQIMRSCRYSLL